MDYYVFFFFFVKANFARIIIIPKTKNVIFKGRKNAYMSVVEFYYTVSYEDEKIELFMKRE